VSGLETAAGGQAFGQAGETRELLMNSFGGRNHGFVHDHPRHWLPVFFLFGSVNAMRLRVDGETVYLWLHMKVLQLPEVVGSSSWTTIMTPVEQAA
jgi:hypothetical protein